MKGPWLPAPPAGTASPGGAAGHRGAGCGGQQPALCCFRLIGHDDGCSALYSAAARRPRSDKQTRPAARSCCCRCPPSGTTTTRRHDDGPIHHLHHYRQRSSKSPFLSGRASTLGARLSKQTDGQTGGRSLRRFRLHIPFPRFVPLPCKPRQRARKGRHGGGRRVRVARPGGTRPPRRAPRRVHFAAVESQCRQRLESFGCSRCGGLIALVCTLGSLGCFGRPGGDSLHRISSE